MSNWQAKHPNHRVWLVLFLATGTGLALRLILFNASGWRFDYDEGMAGLVAIRIMHGDFPVFHPGQPYLGALESYILAPIFRLFGPTPITLKSVPWLVSGGYVFTTGLIGWRAFGARIGALASLLAACAPTYLLSIGTKTWGATAETLFLGNLAILLTYETVELTRTPSTRNRSVVALAFVGGMAFWVSWLIAFYALPILSLLFWKARPTLRQQWWKIATAFLLGSAPLWVYNMNHSLETFTFLLEDQATDDVTWGEILEHFNHDLVPRLLSGDSTWNTLSKTATHWLQFVYESGWLALAAWLWKDPWQRKGRNLRILLGLFALTFLPIYVGSGFGSHAINPFGFDATGRYALMAHSALPVGAAALIVWIGSRTQHAWISTAVVIISVLSLNLVGAARSDLNRAFTSPYYTRQPSTLQPLIDFLDEQNIRHVWTDVGIAHVLMSETNERILAADWYDIYGAKGILRFPEVPEQIRQASRVAYVEVTLPNQQNTRFEQAFLNAGIPFAKTQITPDMLVITPLITIDPSTVGDGLGYQF